MLAQVLLAQGSKGDLIAPEVTFCGCAASVPAAADERQSWILLQWKTLGLMDLEAKTLHRSLWPGRGGILGK